MFKRGLIFGTGLVLGLILASPFLQAQVPSYSNVSSVTSPASYAAAITTSDTTDLTVPCRAVYVGGAGNVVVDFVNGGSSITLTGATVGSVLPIRVKRVRTSTATNMVCLY